MADRSPQRYECWKERLAGGKAIVPTAENMAGFWRSYWSKPRDGMSNHELIAIWYEDDGSCVMQSTHRNGAKMDKAAIFETVFPWCSVYPLTSNVYTEASKSGELPPIYQTRLSLEQSKVGTVWTADIGMKIMERASIKAAGKTAMANAKADQPEPSEPGIGDNSQPMGVDQTFLGTINDQVSEFNLWLKSIGGKVSTQEHQDRANGFAKRFQQYRIAAEDERTKEKKPYLDAGKAIDAKWKLVTSAADNAQKSAAACQAEYLRIQREKAADEAAEAQRQAMAARAEAPVNSPPARAPIAMPTIETGVKLKDVKVLVVDDMDALLKEFMSTPVAQRNATEWAERVLRDTDKCPSGTSFKIEQETRL